jgi:hypothetical protein
LPDFKDMIIKAKPAAPSKFIIMGDPMTGKTTAGGQGPAPAVHLDRW